MPGKRTFNKNVINIKNTIGLWQSFRVDVSFSLSWHNLLVLLMIEFKGTYSYLYEEKIETAGFQFLVVYSWCIVNRDLRSIAESRQFSVDHDKIALVDRFEDRGENFVKIYNRRTVE